MQTRAAAVARLLAGATPTTSSMGVAQWTSRKTLQHLQRQQIRHAMALMAPCRLCLCRKGLLVQLQTHKQQQGLQAGRRQQLEVVWV